MMADYLLLPMLTYLTRSNVPEYDFSVEQYKEVIKYYQKNLANNYGLTLIDDAAHSDNATMAYKELAESGELTISVRGVHLLENKNSEEALKNILCSIGRDNGGDLFQINTVKIFLEGEPVTCEPYEESVAKACGKPEGYHGRLFWKDEDLIRHMSDIIKAGLQIHLHAMGDLSVKQAVECLCKAQGNAETEQRNVIAHLMLVKVQRSNSL